MTSHVNIAEVDEYFDAVDEGEEFMLDCAHIIAWKIAIMYKVDGTATYQQAHMAATMVLCLERCHNRSDSAEILKDLLLYNSGMKS